MKIDGRLIAQEINSEIYDEVRLLHQKNIIPHLAVILVGKDKGSQTFVVQKQKLGQKLSVKVSLYHFDSLTKQDLIKLADNLNNSNVIHGVIIQRPIPVAIEARKLNELVDRQKDVDSFHPESFFDPPVGQAVIKILEYIFKYYSSSSSDVISGESRSYYRHPDVTSGSTSKRMDSCLPAGPPAGRSGRQDLTPGMTNFADKSFFNWLKKKKILVIGRGETAGKPIAKYLSKLNLKSTVAHSQTKNLKSLCLTSDIIISCVGKSNIVRHDMITVKTILIGVGLHPEEKKLTPDYDQKRISQKALFYTPVPGGVGPVNVAYLMKNVIEAAKKIINY